MTRAQRWGWVLIALAVALGLLFAARPAAGEDNAFMPKGGRSILGGLLASPTEGAALRDALKSRRSAPEWRAFLEGRKSLSERDAATLAAYLEVNAPLKPEDPPADGRALAENECQSCHSLFASYLTQSRDVQGWRNIFLSPFHRQMKLTPQEREEFARYSALNMPMKIDDIPADLRF